MQKEMTEKQRAKKNQKDRERRARIKRLAKRGEIRESKGTLHETRRAQVAAVAAKIVENPAMKISDAIRGVGLSEHIATHPSAITSTPEWAQLLDEMLPQGEILETHRGLLRASKVDHMIFADGPKTEAECNEFLTTHNAKNKKQMERDDVLTDDDIRLMIEEKNCKVRKISRTENSRHVYFFAPDNRARKDALEMAYKLRGSFAADKAAVAFSLAALAQARDAKSDEGGNILQSATHDISLPNAE